MLRSSWRSLSRRLSQTFRETYQIAQLSQQLGFKGALLQEAQVSAGPYLSGNQTAVSFLRAEREWALLKYHGPTQYIRNHWQQRQNMMVTSAERSYSLGDKKEVSNENPLSSSTLASSESPTANSPNTHAQVAVMITSRMRQELTHALNHDPQRHIAKLTPLQASLILQHRLDATDSTYHERLQELEQAYLADRERAHQEQLADKPVAQPVNAQANLLSPSVTDSEHQSSSTAETRNPYDNQAPGAANNSVPTPKNGFRPLSFITSSASINQLSSKDASTENRVDWFELRSARTETFDSEESNQNQAMGLYRTREEAEEALETLHYFAKRRNESIFMKIVPVERP
jgi:hypothetical protein